VATVLFVYAHPDDESFGIAGTAMKLQDEGHMTALLTLTRGDAGLWFGKERGSWTPEELARERAKEWHAATEVVQMIRDTRPDIVCTFGPEGAGSEHDDHRAASLFALRGFHRAANAEAFPERGVPHEARRLFFNAAPFAADFPILAMTPTHAIDIRKYEERKKQAFECHKTQAKDRERFYQLLERRAGREFFHLAIDRAAGPASSVSLLR
jgi:LmbE family N-acetylglucosaminyl deacetylase